MKVGLGDADAAVGLDVVKGGKDVRSDHDNTAANNLLQSFKANETSDVVVKNR